VLTASVETERKRCSVHGEHAYVIREQKKNYCYSKKNDDNEGLTRAKIVKKVRKKKDHTSVKFKKKVHGKVHMPASCWGVAGGETLKQPPRV